MLGPPAIAETMAVTARVDDVHPSHRHTERPLDGLTPEHRVGDLKAMLKAYLTRQPIFLVKGQAPPGSSGCSRAADG